MGSIFGGGGGGEASGPQLVEYRSPNPNQPVAARAPTIADILAMSRQAPGQGKAPQAQSGMAENLARVAGGFTTDTSQSVVNAGDALANYYMQQSSAAQPSATSALGYSDQRFPSRF